MALKQFLSSSIKWVPQAGFSVVYTENGGIDAAQDILVRNSDLQAGSVLTAFQRGVTWESIFPEVPPIYRNLTLKTYDPTDRGDGFSITKCTFTGYQYAGSGGSSGDETEQATSTLTGQLNPEALSDHPKWVALTAAEKVSLGNLLSGEWSYIQDPFTPGEFVLALNIGDGQYSIRPSEDQVTSEDGLMFVKIIAEGESTWDRGGWTYSYHTESETGFTAAQLNKLGKIVPNPPGNPQKPGTGWTWLLASPNQTQSGLDRFMKTLDFRLIRDNAKNQFLYGE
jgi:hypothetical protein